MTVSTYPPTCGDCVIAIDTDAIAAAIKRGEEATCPKCGKVFHRGGTQLEAVREILAAR